MTAGGLISLRIPSNARAHYLHTGSGNLATMEGRIDTFVSVAGTGGTIGGNSRYFKEKNPNIDVGLLIRMALGFLSFCEPVNMFRTVVQ